MVTEDIHHHRREAYNTAYEETYSLKESINPDDVTVGAETWDETTREDIDREIHEAVDVIMSEGQFRNKIEDLAMREWLDVMSRVQLEHMVFDSHKEALENGYHPYDTSYLGAISAIRDLVFEHDVEIPPTARNSAKAIVRKALADKLDPAVEEKDHNFF